MARSKQHREPARQEAATASRGAIARADAAVRGDSVDIDLLSRPRFSRDLVPVFMMIESDLFRRLNEKAAARRTGYDMLLRTILRDHLGKYLQGSAPPEQPARAAPRKRDARTVRAPASRRGS